jgi:hypothetical protein
MTSLLHHLADGLSKFEGTYTRSCSSVSVLSSLSTPDTDGALLVGAFESLHGRVSKHPKSGG